MEYEVNQIKEIIERNLNKGEPIVKIGASGTGKSTLDSELAKNKSVSKMLHLREVDNRKKAIETEIIVTDDRMMPEDAILVHMDVDIKTLYNIGSDTLCLSQLIAILLSDNDFVERFLKAKSDAEKASIIRSIDIEFSKMIRVAKDRELIAYMMKEINPSQKENISTYIYELLNKSIDRVFIDIYRKATEEKSMNEKMKLIENLIIKNEKNKEIVDIIFNKIIECINPKEDKFLEYVEYLKAKKALEEDENNISSECREEYEKIITKMDEYMAEKSIYISCGEDENELKISTIIKSEDILPEYLFVCGFGFRDYLIKKMVLIYRGEDDLLDNDKLTVMEDKSGKVHIIRLIDTLGISNSIGIYYKKEAERIKETIKKYHSNYAILFYNVENGENVDFIIEEFLSNSRKDNLTIYPVFTKLDSFVNGRLNEAARRDEDVNTDEIIQKRKKIKLEKIEELSGKYLDRRGKKSSKTRFYRRKEKLEIFMAGFFNKDKNQYSYDSMKRDLIKSICENMIPKVIVHESDTEENILEDWSKFSPEEKNSAFKNIGELYNGLCENIAYSRGISEMPPEHIRVCINKWLNYGKSYKSNINKCYTYENVDTNFVEHISEIPVKIQKELNVQNLLESVGVKMNLELNEEDILKIKEFEDFVRNNFTDRVGDYLARNIGAEAYYRAYIKEKEKYQSTSDRYNTMIKYVLETYFNSKQMDVENESLRKEINKAVDEYMKEVIDRKCIVVA